MSYKFRENVFRDYNVTHLHAQLLVLPLVPFVGRVAVVEDLLIKAWASLGFVHGELPLTNEQFHTNFRLRQLVVEGAVLHPLGQVRTADQPVL